LLRRAGKAGREHAVGEAGSVSFVGTAETRRLTAADVDAFRAIYVEALTLHPAAFWSTPEEEQARSDDAIRHDLDSDYVVGGFARGGLNGIAIYTRRSGTKLCHKGLLTILYVREAVRGTGMADALMEAVVRHAAVEVEALLLNVTAENARALRFYRRWGFEAYGVEPGCVRLPGDRYLDEVLMTKRLAGGGGPPTGTPVARDGA
jgi:ribosomal protein S18 acetylase RimI-like enzyme